MENIQPNFERVKTAFYNAFYKGEYATNAILLSSVANRIFKPHYKKREDFLTDFNKWLGSVDIRMVGAMVDILNKHKISIPKWISHKKYCIDYNKKGFLDIVPYSSDY